MPDFGDRRVMACTPADLKRWLGELCGCDLGLRTPSHPGSVGAATIDADGLTLSIVWRVLEPRRIALLHIQQLELQFDYPPEQAEAARDWIARFDRHTQRGGG